MDVREAKEKINFVREKLLEVQRITYLPDSMYAEVLSARDSMEESYPEESKAVRECWDAIQRSLPSGISVDGNLVRHLSFNQATDWFDISRSDIPRELTKLKEYEQRLALIVYMESLHPQVARVSEIVLNGDIDAGLKTVFASLDASIRAHLKVRPNESSVSMIGKAFKDGDLVARQPENSDSARNFLQGVVGYYRSIIVHNALSQNRNSVEGALSLFALAHEAFRLFDSCAREQEGVPKSSG